MKTLYLHIGTQKTGTTSIQSFCGDNAAVFEKKGYCYPIFPYKYPCVVKERNGHFLVGAVKDEKGQIFEGEDKKIFEDGMKRVADLFLQYDNVVLSDEHIWRNTFERRKSLWEELKKHGEENGYRVQIIVYLRRQDQYAISLWNQTVKTSVTKAGAKRFDEYIENVPKVYQLDYYKKLESIAKVLGKDAITVRRYERDHFYGGSIYADFLHAINLELTDDFKIVRGDRNFGLQGNTHEIKRVLNSLPEMLDADVNHFFRQTLLSISQTSAKEYQTSMLSAEETEEFMQKYEEGNQAIVREYFKEDGTELFHTEVTSLPKWTKDNPYMQDDLIRFVGVSAIHLLEENRKIQEENRKIKEELKQMKDELAKVRSFQNKLKHPFRTLGQMIRRKFGSQK